MKTIYDIKTLDRLQREGKIKGYSADIKKPLTAAGKIVSKHYKRKSKALDWISSNILYWANAKGLQLIEEYKFDENRKWRFDFCLPAIKAAVEFEGGVYQANTSHNSPRTLTKDTEKYNSAASQGWTVLRFTAINYASLLTELNKLL